jgi:hypothetical protein
MGDALLTRAEVAERLGVSLSTAERHVLPALPVVRIGSLLRYEPEDVDRWRDAQKDGRSNATRVPGRGSSASGRRTVVGSTDPQVREIAERLSRRARESTARRAASGKR